MVYSFSQDHRRKADFSRLTPTLWAVASPNNNKTIIIIIIMRTIQNKSNLFASYIYKCFFSVYFSLQFRKVRYIIKSGVEERAQGGIEDMSHSLGAEGAPGRRAKHHSSSLVPERAAF